MPETMSFAEWLCKYRGMDWAYFDNNYEGVQAQELYNWYLEDMGIPIEKDPDEDYISEEDWAEYQEYNKRCGPIVPHPEHIDKEDE